MAGVKLTSGLPQQINAFPGASRQVAVGRSQNTSLAWCCVLQTRNKKTNKQQLAPDGVCSNVMYRYKPPQRRWRDPVLPANGTSARDVTR